MQTYRIVGADQKEYGPVTADQIRYWIAEGRANAQTQVRPEGETEWRPIAAFPEFAAALTSGAAVPSAAVPAPFQASPGSRDAALQAVKGPAIALMVTAILGLLFTALGLVGNIIGLAGGHPTEMPEISDPQVKKLLEAMQGGMGVMGIIQNLVAAAVGVVVFIGSLKMMKLESYQFVFTATILAMVPCISPCCWLGLPFGIWALIVLNRPDVKFNFS